MALCCSSVETGASRTGVDVDDRVLLATGSSFPSCSGVVRGGVVALAVDSVGCAERMCRRAKRFLSEDSTACLISSKVTLRDFSLRHWSWVHVSQKLVSSALPKGSRVSSPRPRRSRSPVSSSSILPSRPHVEAVGSLPWRSAHRGSALGREAVCPGAPSSLFPS